MRIALCINGIYRPNVYPTPTKLIDRMINKFGADTFFHTWEEYKHTVPKDYHHNLFACDEPVLNYHPVTDNKVGCKHAKYEEYKNKRILHDKMAHASKQILGYADLLSKIDVSKYDVIIRARWDTIISSIVDFAPFIDSAVSSPVGFMIRPNRGHLIDDIIEVSKTSGKSDDWYGYLPDVLIFHNPKLFNINYVHQLHKDQSLLPAEWGWYQVLSEPYGDIHYSIHGGASIAR